ncbi:MAG TPA: GWxTD domain-containing protein [Terriglobia bacterium]|nr:GWxTD domain-containing protein [Terriglobia bacterium]
MTRIQSLLYTRSTKGIWTPMLAGVILIATAAVGLATWPQAQRKLIATQRLASMVESNPNNDWLDGPVTYIINPREREAFEKLITGEERLMFIQQFWERRNPEPGSRTNNFKEEFNRRVNFADAHFVAGYPGWKSDRGHLYILCGPPDEIQYHPTSTPYHFSLWKYQHLGRLGDDVVFVFVDMTGNGDYRIAAPPWK